MGFKFVLGTVQQLPISFSFLLPFFFFLKILKDLFQTWKSVFYDRGNPVI